MDALSSSLAVLLALGTVFWLILGGPSRARERAQDRRRRGGRNPPSQGFWSFPSRDREYVPGLLLLIVSTWQLTGVAGQGATFTPVLILSGVLAVGFSVRGDLVGAGMGLVGAVSQTLDRLGVSPCLTYSPAQQAAYFVGSGLFILALLGLHLILKPIRSGSRFLTGTTNFWTSPGRSRRPGTMASLALSTAGALALIDLSTRPGVIVIDQSKLVLVIVTALFAGCLLAAALTILPTFTLSVLGLGTVAAAVLIDYGFGLACDAWSTRLAVAGGLLVVNRIASRFI